MNNVEIENNVVLAEGVDPVDNLPGPRGRITDEKLPLRFGNRKQRRKLESEIRKIK